MNHSGSLILLSRTTCLRRRNTLQGLSRPHRAAARGEGAPAPWISRPAVGPPAHVVARAALEKQARREESEQSGGGGIGVGAEGCKIKGGISRKTQHMDLREVFAFFLQSSSFRWISRLFQLFEQRRVLRYPTSRANAFPQEST
jgi:hypothetical protein